MNKKYIFKKNIYNAHERENIKDDIQNNFYKK